MNRKISVIVPIYNAEKYLNKCIDSILHQTLEELEIILIDDGSTDSSAQICDNYARDDKRVIVIHKENGGLISARQVGIMTATADYVIYVDSDDWIELDQCEKLYSIIKNDKTDLVVCDHFTDMMGKSLITENAIANGVFDRERIEKEVFPKIIGNGTFFAWNIFPSLCDKIFKREKLLPFQMAVDERIVIGEDAAVSIPYIANCNSISVVHNAFYHYVQHFDSMVRTKQDSNRDRKKFRILYEYLFDNLKAFIKEDILKQQLRDYILYIALPRVTGLTKNYLQNVTLFPFVDVSKESRVVLYGAGLFGINMYRFLKETEFCRVVNIVDREYEIYRDEGFPVANPEMLTSISNDEFDYVIITVMSLNAQMEIKKTLAQIGVPDEKIEMIDMKKANEWLDSEILSAPIGVD